MLDTLRLLARRNPVALGLFVAAVLVTLFFGIRLALAPPRFPGPEMRDPPIAGWMTPRYIAHAWHVPPRLVVETLGIDPATYRRPPPLDRIAQDTGIPLPQLITMIEAAIKKHRDE